MSEQGNMHVQDPPLEAGALCKRVAELTAANNKRPRLARPPPEQMEQLTGEDGRLRPTVYTEDNPPPPPPGSPPKSLEIGPALHRITNHIIKPAKLAKAVALVEKLLDSGSCKPHDSQLLLQVVDASLVSQAWVEPAAQREYKRLFKALDKHIWIFEDLQRKQLEVYRLLAVTRPCLVSTDDSFVFNKLIGELKTLLRKSSEVDEAHSSTVHDAIKSKMQRLRNACFSPSDSDADGCGMISWDSEETDLMMKDAILDCLDAMRKLCYHKQWARTSIDIALLDTWEQLPKFCSSQQSRVHAGRAFVIEQRARRKQAPTASAERSYATSFETTSAAWSTSKVSHRGNVGGGGDHKPEMWLG